MLSSLHRHIVVVRLIMLALLLPCAASARMLTVGGDSEFKTVADALAADSNGDTVYVTAGRYYEFGLRIDHSITLTGAPGAIIDGQGRGQIISVVSSNVSITCLTVRGAGVSFIDDNSAILLEKVSGCTVSDCILEDNFFGIYLAQSQDCRISHNRVTGMAVSEASSGNGIHLWYCREVEVTDNCVSNHRDGIYFEFVVNCDIKNNKSHKNLRYGLHFMYSDSCLYSYNAFVDNGAGVAVMYTRYVKMSNNTFEGNWGPISYGLLLKDITDSEVSNNAFEENSVAVYLENSNRIVIKENHFQRNGWAIKIMSNSIDNTFSRNNFVGNSFQVASNSRNNFSIFEGNYWSDYSGYDLNRDGIGDVPFRPVRLFSLEVERHPPALILLHSLFVDLLNASEQVVPTLTPETLVDKSPLMRPLQ